MALITDMSPRLKARMAGVFELFGGLTGAAGQMLVLGHLVVSTSAAATAANILAHPRLFVLGFAWSNIAVACQFVSGLLLYELFKSVHRRVARLAILVMVVACAFQALACLFYVAPLPILAGGPTVSAFTPKQLEALAFVFIKFNGYAYDAYRVFFGAWCLLTGYLIVRSTFMPRALGVLLAIGGVGMTFLAPSFGRQLFPWIGAISAAGQISLTVWLLVFGLDAQRWQEQARANAALVRAQGAA